MKSLECQICFHEFDECRRRPRILSCGHTFCSICLKSLFKEGRIACPTCKKYHIADSVENININFILEKFISPDDTSKEEVFDTGYKCKEHFYEQNFFCETHGEWICRDCTVLKHKPCSHSETCGNKNDCKVLTKTEILDQIKSDKIEKIKRNSESYGLVLSWHINQFDSKINAMLTQREDLQKRLTTFAKENELEIEELRKKVDVSQIILSNVQKNRNLVQIAQHEIMKAHGRTAVEESCINVDMVIEAAVEWATKEKYNIKENKKCIADIKINLKEFETMEQNLCEAKNMLVDSEKEIKDLRCKIDEHMSTINQYQTKVKIVEKSNLELQNSLENIKQSSICKDNKIRVYSENISELQRDLESSNSVCERYRNKIITLENNFERSVKKFEKCTNSCKDKNKNSVVETKQLFEVKNHLLDCHQDAYLLAKLFNENGVLENYYGQLKVYAHGNEEIVLVEAFQKFFSPGSLLLQCHPLISNINTAEYVYLDIGKMEVFFTPEGGRTTSLLGNPFGRLYIELLASPRRKQQMINMCSSIDSEQLKHCNFSVIRNQDRPGELVTCKHYLKIINDCEQTRCEVMYTDLENSNEEHPIDAGNVFGYLDGSAGFSIITRDNPFRDTRWPLLGRVASGLHYLQKAVRNYNVETIGIHSHGIGFSSCLWFPTKPCNP